ncbi:hypothetical protein PCARR_a3327 [Pseudoalteromonas carrageenovora IAM 12662]|uniref:Uncharacterized protein n=1 Tax=Pseudoalteromonas carrageenovora IAM 12662 TaxID=1314868 RepID=A0ABR9EMA3_PSEVC|nr:hypothetical protein [Pseudoalteromonas carrageenovora IAM 12662]GEB70545.1 hypothetical protein PCA01_12550 [Pseudoalteromonas carrageenovora]
MYFKISLNYTNINTNLIIKKRAKIGGVSHKRRVKYECKKVYSLDNFMSALVLLKGGLLKQKCTLKSAHL